MAKKIQIDIEVNGKMQKATVSTKKLRDALDGVEKSHRKVGKSAGELDRNLKGTAQATSNGTKEFSKMSQGMGGLVGVYATIAAQVFAVSAAFQFLKSASEVTNLIKGQEAMGATTGVAYKTITNALKQATDGQLQYAEAARAAAIGTAAGLNPDQLERLGVAAKNTSLALGRDLTDSFNRLVRGVTKAEPELLDELGIVLRLKEATEEYAVSIGKPVGELNQFERSQAVVNNVLGQAEQKFGAIQKIMDPSATSLNRFLASFDELVNTLKTNVIDGLVPVFDFLSERTGALTTSLALFALPIIKSILPSFDAMAANATAAIEIQEEKLSDLSSAYEKTRFDIEALGATQQEAQKITEKSGKAVYESIGIDPKKVRTKGGFGAADFLTGGATSAKAQANANKVLKNAEAQIKKHGRVLTGHLKGATAEQVKDLRSAYTRKTAILKNYEKQHGASWKKQTLQVQQYATKSKMAIAGLQKTTARASKLMGKALGGAFKLAGFVGIIMLLVDMGKALKEYFFPVPEETVKAEKAISAFKDSTETLNEELERMSRVRADHAMQTLQERVIALGNAFTSANLKDKFAEFQDLDQTSAGFAEAKKEMERTISTLGKLSPEFAELAKNLDLSNITDESRNALIQFANKMSDTGASATNLANSLQTIRGEMAKLAGTGKAIDPTITLRAALKTGLEESKKLVEGAQTDLLNLQSRGESDEVKAARKELKDLQGREARTFTGGFFSIAGGMTTRQARKDAEVAAAQKRLDDLEAATTETDKKSRAEKEKELKDLQKQQAFLNAQNNAFNDISKEAIANNNKLLDLKLDQAKKQTLGITLSQKQTNLDVRKLGLEEKMLSAQQRLLFAQASYNAAYAEGSEATEEQKAAANDALIAAEENLYITEAQVDLETQRIGLEEGKLNFQKILNKLKVEELGLQERLNKAAREEKRIKSGLTGAFGFEQARQLALAEEARLKASLAQAKQAEATAKARMDETNRLALSGGASIENLLGDFSSFLTARNRTKDLQLEVDLFNDRGNALVRELNSQLELTNARRAALSLNPVEQKYQEFLISAKSKGIALTEEQKSTVRKLIEEQEIANRLLAAQEDIYKSIEQGMTSAFASIIDGTKSVKEAFLNMGQMILQVIARIIAEMIALKIMQTIVGLGSPSAGGGNVVPDVVVRDKAGMVVQTTARYGGIFGKGAGYSEGGVAKGPQAGYPVIMHGTEAIVPLPNGKSIPVEMRGSGQQNNVVVNVSVDNQGNATQDTQASNNDAGRLGSMIAGAVQKELQNQKRAGGILSPMGVS